MKLWWWRVRYAFWIWRGCGFTCIQASWYSALVNDTYEEDWNPRDAAEEEMSYWEE